MSHEYKSIQSSSNVVYSSSDVELKTFSSEFDVMMDSKDNASSISRSQLRKIFDKFDDDNTETLNISEFSSACYCIIGPKNLSNIDILSIFYTIDHDNSGTISFDDFCEFVEPSNMQSNSMASPHLQRYTSCTPPPSQFDDDYESTFWTRDMGVILCSGTHGINAYIKWRFTFRARAHISSGSKIMAINDKNMNGLLFDEVTAFLNIVIINTQGFRVKFRPKCKLISDQYLPEDFRTYTNLRVVALADLDDELDDSQLLKPRFDKKKLKTHSIKKILTAPRNSRATETSMLSLTELTETCTSFDFGLQTSHEVLEQAGNIKISECWFRCPKLIRKALRIKRISRLRELRLYGTHCRHCPLKAQHCRTVIHNLFDNEKYSKLSYGIQIFIMTMILISTMAYIIETLPVFRENEDAQKVFLWIETIVSLIFTVEYMLRIIASRNLCVFFWDMLNVIDFIAIIPFWIELIAGAQGSSALRVIRVIRLARVFRLMKSPRFAEYMSILHRTLVNSMGSFGLFLTLIFLEIIVASSLVYVCEQPMENTKFVSIPSTSWWAFVTVTTIGYGDMVPQSVLGRIICVFTLFTGLLVIALPVIIIGGNFNEEYNKYIQHKAGWSASFDFKGDESRKQQIFTVARLLHFINDKQCRDIFEWQDVKYLCDEGLDSFEIINKILSLDHGHCYLPATFSAYKKYAMFEFYGKPFRIKQRKKEMKRYLTHQRLTKSQPPPSSRQWGRQIAGILHIETESINDSLCKETDTLLISNRHGANDDD
eukprot:106569_1